MNVNLKCVCDAIKSLESHHLSIRGISGKSQQFEEGFIEGLKYVREFVMPTYETSEIDESESVKSECEQELEDYKTKVRFGLEDE